MKHDLIVDEDAWGYSDEHWGYAKCRRCEAQTTRLCCREDFLDEDCPSGQLELLDTELSLLV